MKLTKSIFVIVLCIGMAGSLHAQNHEYKLDKNYNIADGGTIHLSSNDAEVTIEGSNRSDVHLNVYRNVDVSGWKLGSSGEFKMDVTTNNGDLTIEESNSEDRTIVFGGIKEEYRITLEVPTKVSLKIKGDDDSYQIANIDGNLDISADDMSADLKNISGPDYRFNMDDGTISLDQAAGKLALNMDDGAFNLDSAKLSAMNASYDDGNLDVTTSLANKGSYNVQMDDGELQLNITGGGGRFHVNHDDPSFNLADAFKDVSIEDEISSFRLPGGNAQINIQTDDGDIDLQAL